MEGTPPHVPAPPVTSPNAAARPAVLTAKVLPGAAATDACAGDGAVAAADADADAEAGAGERVPRRESWVPLAFACDISSRALRRVTVHGDGYVLFRAADGTLCCLADRCAHRAARLSDGRWCNGRIECLYHGWQYDTDGVCARIPQLEAGSAIPARARVQAMPLLERQGVVWMWRGSAPPGDAAAITTIDDLERDGCRSIDFAIDLPYGDDWLLENVLDIAHIHVAHDGVRGGGRRERAAPLVFDVTDHGAGGFTASFGTVARRTVDHSRTPTAAGASVRFVAPGLVHYRAQHRDPQRCSGLALYAVPLGPGRCRLLYRAYANTWSWRDRLRPRWLEHRHQLRLLEQDMALVIGQAAEVDRAATALRALWLPLRTSDALVLRFRQWVDAHAGDRTDCAGWERRAAAATTAPRFAALSRETLHTRHCAACERALRACRWSSPLLGLLAFSALALACISGSPWRLPFALLAVVAQGAALAARAQVRQLTGGSVGGD